MTLSISIERHRAECHYSESRICYANLGHDECRYAGCYYDECRGAECRGAKINKKKNKFHNFINQDHNRRYI